MDHFEGLVNTLLEADGHWVRQSYKVNLTTDEKRRIGKHSIPRPELDLLAFKPGANEVVVWEVKSLLDSRGVVLRELQQAFAVPTGRYKLFTCAIYRETVLARLRQDLVAAGMATEATTIRLGLALGNVAGGDHAAMRDYLESHGWLFLDPDEIAEKVRRLAKTGYANDPAIIVAKILERSRTDAS